jgi:hypothetical protein
MTRLEAVTLIQDRLGQRTGIENQIVKELQAAQRRLEAGATLPWFLLKKSTALATVANTQTLALPAGFLLENEEGGFWIQDTDGERTFLVKGDYGTFSVDECLLDSDNPVRRPTNYSLIAGVIYFFPIPTAVYPLEMTYYGADTVLTTDAGTNLWLLNASEVLICRAGMSLAKFLRDGEALAIFSDDFREAWADLLAKNIQFKMAGMGMVLGG